MKYLVNVLASISVMLNTITGGSYRNTFSARCRYLAYVIGSTPGDYIVPVRNEDGSIGALAVKDPNFEQYRRAVGVVWKTLDDGIAWIAVKVL